VHRHFWAKSGFLLGGFPVTVLFFSLAVTGFSAAAGTAVIYLGVFIGAGTLAMAHGFALVKQVWLARCGFEIPRLPARPAPPGKRQPVRRVLRVYAAGERWRELLFAVVELPVAIFTFTVTVVWWAVTLNGPTYWFWQQFINPSDRSGYRDPITHKVQNQGLADVMHLSMGNSWLYFWFGLFTLVTIIPVIHAMTLIHVGVAKGLLRPSRRAIAKRMAELAESRSQATAAQTRDLRRIEQDLHDGPQQRLVRLGMDLAAAQRRLGSGDSAATAQLLDEARDQVAATLAEIRQISRSVAPPILADQGLAAAVEALGAASPVPAVVDAQPVRLSDATATAVYFAVSEALANVAKHASAHRVAIRLWRADDDGSKSGVVRCQIDDDGNGGALIVPGHGLAGLRDRLAGVDGRLDVAVNADGGTSVRIEVPGEK